MIICLHTDSVCHRHILGTRSAGALGISVCVALCVSYRNLIEIILMILEIQVLNLHEGHWKCNLCSLNMQSAQQCPCLLQGTELWVHSKLVSASSLCLLLLYFKEKAFPIHYQSGVHVYFT